MKKISRDAVGKPYLIKHEFEDGDKYCNVDIGYKAYLDECFTLNFKMPDDCEFFLPANSEVEIIDFTNYDFHVDKEFTKVSAFKVRACGFGPPFFQFLLWENQVTFHDEHYMTEREFKRLLLAVKV